MDEVLEDLKESLNVERLCEQCKVACDLCENDPKVTLL